MLHYFSARGIAVILLASFFLAGSAVCAREVAGDFFSVKTEKAYDLVLEDAEFAIRERNFRIISRLHIGQAMQRGEESALSPQIETILFCSIGHLQVMMADDERLVDYCPMKIIVRQQEINGPTVVVVPLLPETSSPHTKLVNRLLRSMVRYATSE